MVLNITLSQAWIIGSPMKGYLCGPTKLTKQRKNIKPETLVPPVPRSHICHQGSHQFLITREHATSHRPPAPEWVVNDRTLLPWTQSSGNLIARPEVCIHRYQHLSGTPLKQPYENGYRWYGALSWSPGHPHASKTGSSVATQKSTCSD